MSTVLTQNLQLQNIVTGTQPTTWWNTENFDRTLEDQAVAGVSEFPVTGDLTLPIQGNIPPASSRVWVFTGSPSVPATITYAPNTSQNWALAINQTGQPLTFSQGSGTTVVLSPGLDVILLFDGTGAAANCTQFNFNPTPGLGSAAVPAYSFTGYTDVGLYGIAGPAGFFPHAMNFACDGVTMVGFIHSHPSFASQYGLNIWGGVSA